MKNRKSNTKLSDCTVDDIRRGILEGVGYRNPPVHTRFRKGQSGNLAGRPRKADQSEKPSVTNKLLLREIERKVTIVENGAEHQITMHQAIIKAQARMAIKGNAYAQERLLVRIEKAEKEREAQIAAENKIVNAYIARRRAELLEAQAANLPESPMYPHPDDLIVEEGKPCRLFGPATKEEAEWFEGIVQMRDLLFMQSTLAAQPDANQFSVELLYAMLINARLPLRMRLDDDAWLDLTLRYHRTARRERAKQVQDGWRRRGIHVPKILPCD